MNRIEKKIYLVTKIAITAVVSAVFITEETYNGAQHNPGGHRPVKRVEAPITQGRGSYHTSIPEQKHGGEAHSTGVGRCGAPLSAHSKRIMNINAKK